MDFKQIQELIKLVGKSEIGEVKIKDGDFQIMLRSNSYFQSINDRRPVTHVSAPMPVTSMPAQNQPSAPQQSSAEPFKAESQPSTEEANKENEHTTIKSPMIGTFYRSPSPDKEPFAKVGDIVQKGDVLCVIEAMKLFNEIESEYTGKIVKVIVEDSSPVEYDQPLFVIDTNIA